jgi:hypothetical protein
MSETTQTDQKRRIPVRNRVLPGEAIAAIQKHHGLLSMAARSLGCSTASMLNMVSRNPRVARAVKDAHYELTDVAVARMHELVQARDFRACAFWLSSKMGRERGFAPPASEPVNGDQPRQITEVVWRIIGPATANSSGDVAKVIEHEAIADSRTAADL